MKNLQGTLYILSSELFEIVYNYNIIFVKSCTLLQYSEHLLSIYLSFSPCLNLFIYTCIMFHWIFLMYLVQPHQKVSSTPSAGTFLTLSFLTASCTTSHLFNGFKFKLRNEHFMWLRNGIVAPVPPPCLYLTLLMGNLATLPWKLALPRQREATPYLWHPTNHD